MKLATTLAVGSLCIMCAGSRGRSLRSAQYRLSPIILIFTLLDVAHNFNIYIYIYNFRLDPRPTAHLWKGRVSFHGGGTDMVVGRLLMNHTQINTVKIYNEYWHAWTTKPKFNSNLISWDISTSVALSNHFPINIKQQTTLGLNIKIESLLENKQFTKWKKYKNKLKS